MKKTFYIYNDNGEFISEFTGIKTYCKQNGYNNFGTLTTILNFNSNNTETIRSFHGIYPLFAKEKNEIVLKRINKSKNPKGKGRGRYGSKKVYQYSLDGELLNCFNSVREAADSLELGSISTISACCRGKRKQAYCYKWSYVPL